MKKHLPFLSLLFVLFSNHLYSQKFKNALEYLEFVSNEQAYERYLVKRIQKD